MLPSSVLNRRIKLLARILKNNQIIHNYVRAYVTSESVAIGNIIKEIKVVKHPEYVPRNYSKSRI